MEPSLQHIPPVQRQKVKLPPASPDTNIIVKALYQGSLRRFRIKLGECTPQVFVQKIRSLLEVPEEEDIVIERFSDSIGDYVVLDAKEPGVYKQLYRAARAKQKLRIRILTAASEAAPEPAQSDNASIITQETIVAPSTESIISQQPSVDHESLVKEAVNEYMSSDQFDQVLRERVDDAVKKHPPSTEAPKCPKAPRLAPAYDSSFFRNFPLFALYCNNCDADISGEHFHCGQCEGGDYDLCRDCKAKGLHCADSSHFLVKRVFQDGKITASQTTSYSPKRVPSPAKSVQFKEEKKEEEVAVGLTLCNMCGQKVPGNMVVECKECNGSFKSCSSCIYSLGSHNPMHTFVRVDNDFKLNSYQEKMLAAGRGFRHPAICDGCDRNIIGIRNKCLECPDFDFCNECILSAEASHPGHRFAPLASSQQIQSVNTVHVGILCDGVVCKKNNVCTFISGDRYKCSVCYDTDFCASCEAHPLNAHDPTHPLIKLKTSNRLVSVTTLFTDDNKNTNVLGYDTVSNCSVTANPPSVKESNSATEVQTVLDLQPVKNESDNKSVQTLVEQPAPVEEKEVVPKYNERAELKGEFVSEAITDKTVMKPNTLFQQRWTIRCVGASWPVGTTIRFTGGSYMFDPSKNLDATVTDRETKDGETVDFVVNLKAPEHSYTHAVHTSYWHLVSPDGTMFGPSLWCEIKVEEEEKTGDDIEALARLARLRLNDLHEAFEQAQAKVAGSVAGSAASETAKEVVPVAPASPVAEKVEAKADEPAKEEVREVVKRETTEERPEQVDAPAFEEASSVSTSQMIFPVLPKESPAASTHEASSAAPPSETTVEDNVSELSYETGFNSPKAESDFASTLGDEDFDYVVNSDDDFELLGSDEDDDHTLA